MDQINYLPDHILTEIFGNLSPRMIKCCALVCKRWDNIVGTSKELMGRFKLDLYKSDNKIQEAKSLHRNHQTAMIKFQKNSLDIISCHNLQSLSLNFWKPDNTQLTLLIKTLNGLPSLKYLDLLLISYPKNFVVDVHEKVRNNFVELSCGLKIIHLFECYTVEILKLRWSNADEKIKMQAVDFLKKQKNLKTLELIDRYGGELFNLPGILELAFSLKKLKICCHRYPFHYYESLIKFMDRHKSSLTHLNVGFYTEPDFGIEFIHKFALENLINLKHLEMGYIYDENSTYHDDKLTYDELSGATQITTNLESLTTRARSTDINENKRFYDMFPNLKRLYLSLYTDDSNEVLQCVSERCVNLESLEIGTLHKNSKVYFPKLKELTVYSTKNEEHLCSFIRRHSQTLEKIMLNEEEIGFNLAAKEILKCPNLKLLGMARYCINFPVLKAFNEISKKSTPFTLYVSRSRLKFPDDKAFWEEIKKSVIRKLLRINNLYNAIDYLN